MPVDGTYHEWQAGEGLNGISAYYGVNPEDIINYPGNNLDPATIGDRRTQYPARHMAGGARRTPPVYLMERTPRLTRENPAARRVLGLAPATR